MTNNQCAPMNNMVFKNILKTLQNLCRKKLFLKIILITLKLDCSVALTSEKRNKIYNCEENIGDFSNCNCSSSLFLPLSLSHTHSHKHTHTQTYTILNKTKGSMILVNTAYQLETTVLL